MQVRLGMPQMAVRGLSETWLFKFCGDRHWREIARLYGVGSDELVSESGQRVYPSFVAIRGRYAMPIGDIAENTAIDFSVSVDRFGASVIRTIHYGRVNAAETLVIEMITKFVARAQEGSNELSRSSLRPALAEDAPELDAPPELMRDFQKVRAGEPYAIRAPAADTETLALKWPEPYTPNPYVDYNGAGLLYFAAYPPITDHLERLAVQRRARAGEQDWALGASTVSRDIFYFGNLDLGQQIELRSHGLQLAPSAREARLHSTLREAGSGRRLAEVFTVKAVRG